MKDLTVLITASGNVFMPGTTACIKNNGERNIRLIGADMSDDRTMLEMVDAYYAVPRADAPEYAEVLLDICKKEQVDILLPIMSAELETLSENRERFESVGTAVSVSRTEALKIANDKLKLFNFLRNSGIACADFIQVDSVASLRDAVYSMGYPAKRVCVKAPSGSGSRGFRVLDSERRGLDSFLHEKPDSACISFDSFLEYFEGCKDFPDLMVMEFLPGTEYTVDLLADNGKVLYSCCRKSLGMTNSIMLDGMTVDNPAVTTLCESVVKKLGLDGNIGFDLKERADGTVLIMECNPRITAGIPFFKAAGVNLPYLCIKKLLGEPMPELEMTTGLKMKRRYCEMYCST